jgi:prepilin-type N-terminal cleavage/methylation domain-containing protein
MNPAAPSFPPRILSFMTSPFILRRPKPAGFTMVELLVTITIIAVLAAIIFALSRGFLRQAAATRDSSTLRQMWTCIHMYCGDHNDLLPGPLFTRQSVVYNKPVPSNPREWRRLSDCLATYFGYDDPKPGTFLEPMAASWQKTPAGKNAPAYYMQQNLLIGEGRETRNPWGLPAPATAELRNAMRLSDVMAQPRTSRTWAMTEFDQLHPEISDPSLKEGTPEGMTHGRYRLGMYFDGSVRKLNKSNQPL